MSWDRCNGFECDWLGKLHTRFQGARFELSLGAQRSLGAVACRVLLTLFHTKVMLDRLDSGRLAGRRLLAQVSMDLSGRAHVTSEGRGVRAPMAPMFSSARLKLAARIHVLLETPAQLRSPSAQQNQGTCLPPARRSLIHL